jgi:hypothetical protein
MEQPISGEILRAKEAIGMIDRVNLSVPIEIPPVPPGAVIGFDSSLSREARLATMMARTLLNGR